MRAEDLARWIDSPPNSDTFEFDVCLADFQEEHDEVAAHSDPFPIVTFGQNELSRTRDFKSDEINKALSDPISLRGMTPPLSYYPFSDQDDEQHITKKVMQILLHIALKTARGGPSALDGRVIESDEILSKVHPLWDLISEEHKGRLRNRVIRIFQRLLDSELKGHVEAVEERRGYKIQGPLNNFTKKCEELLTQPPIESFGS
ncbi:MAG: hypothetical protein HYY22_03055 [Thaumarchaeota archaeon]|nr:hypothetical protein [Nitrososphaerota archaeon]